MTLPNLIVEAALGTGASTGTLLTLDDAFRGKLDTGTLSGADTVWTDLSAYLVSVRTQRGSTRVSGPFIRYEAGTATIVLENHDRRFDPTNLAGPYVTGGVTQVVPMVAVRVRAEWAGTTYPVWYGYADAWDISWSDPGWSTATLTATDAFKVLSNYSRPAAAPVGAGEDTGARITRILDSVGWPAADRYIQAGNSTLQETDLEGEALAEMQLATESELGELYMGPAGHVTFRGRLGVLTEYRSNTSQGTFGDSGSELPYVDLGISYDHAQLVNYARITREGGAEQAAQDSASQQAYLVRTYERSGLLVQTDTDALNLAQWLVSVGKDPELRFDQMQISPAGTASTSEQAVLWPQALAREIGDRITVRRRPPGGGSTIERDVFVRGVGHDIDLPQQTWRTTWALQSASKAAFLTLDNSILGVLDSNALAY